MHLKKHKLNVTQTYIKCFPKCKFREKDILLLNESQTSPLSLGVRFSVESYLSWVDFQTPWYSI